MNHEIYAHINDTNELVKTHLQTFRELQTSMHDDKVSYEHYIEYSARLMNYFSNRFEELTAREPDEEIVDEDELKDPDYENYDDGDDYNLDDDNL